MTDNVILPPPAAQTKKEKHASAALCKTLVSTLVFPESWKAGEADGEFITSLNTETAEGQAELMRALNSEVPNIETVFNCSITVVAVTIHPATKLDDERGEVTNLIRIVLHCSEGYSYECFSAGALKSLRILRTLKGEQCFATPVKCIPRRVPTSNSKSMIRLEWHI